MYAGKPIIGLAGGIGSGKSFVAALLAEMGCCVIDSDQHARLAYQSPQVKQELHSWWGDSVFDEHGSVSRQAVARRVFADPAQRRRLEALIHPAVAQARQQSMREGAEAGIVAFVWDSPLLFETGLNDQCDVIIFVDSPRAARLDRVRRQRGWSEKELTQRENSQLPLDKKKERAHYVVQNTADAANVREQLRLMLPQILAAASSGSA